jgi:predicted esterase
MNTAEKQVSYQITNTYSTLNQFTQKTKNVWVVFHGLGYLSRYFLRYFKELNSEENYIIAPQAHSKYYLDEKYKHIGASWLTKENTEVEIKNVLNYMEEVYKAEKLQNAPNLIVLGFSQGVSIATRWVTQNKVNCAKLVLCSGKIPADLKSEDFEFLKNTDFSFIYGTKDEYLKEGIIEVEEKRLKTIFPKNLKIIPFNGGHEFNKDLIHQLVN